MAASFSNNANSNKARDASFATSISTSASTSMSMSATSMLMSAPDRSRIHGDESSPASAASSSSSSSPPPPGASSSEPPHHPHPHPPASSTVDPPSFYTIQNRLQQAKKIIQSVTNQTLRNVHSESVILSDRPINVCTYHGGHDDDNDNGDEQRELDLALMLFGDDVTIQNARVSVNTNNTNNTYSTKTRKQKQRHGTTGTITGHEAEAETGSITGQTYSRSLINDEIHQKLSSIESQLDLYFDSNKSTMNMNMNMTKTNNQSHNRSQSCNKNTFGNASQMQIDMEKGMQTEMEYHYDNTVTDTNDNGYPNDYGNGNDNGNDNDNCDGYVQSHVDGDATQDAIMEMDFSSLLLDTTTTNTNTFTGTGTFTSTSTNQNYSDQNSRNNNNNNNNNNDNNNNHQFKQILEKEALDLKSKIHFLQQCTEARIALDDVDLHFNTMTHLYQHQNQHQHQHQHQHHGRSSTSDNNSLDRDNDSRMGTGTVGTALIASATCISRAQMALGQAQQSLTTYYHNECRHDPIEHEHKYEHEYEYDHAHKGKNEEHKQKQHQETQVKVKSKDYQIAQQILESIRTQCIRKIVDLDAKVSSIIDSCVYISSDCITICDYHNNSTSTSTSNSNSITTDKDGRSGSPGGSGNAHYDGLKVAFQVLAILSESSDAHDKLKMNLSTKRSKRKKNRGGNSNSNINSNINSNNTSISSSCSSNDKLSMTLHIIANEIKQKVIKPKIQHLRSCLKRGVPPPSFQLKESTSISTSTSTFASASASMSSLTASLSNGSSGGSTSSFGGNQHNKKMKRNVITLEWVEKNKNIVSKDKGTTVQVDDGRKTKTKSNKMMAALDEEGKERDGDRDRNDIDKLMEKPNNTENDNGNDDDNDLTVMNWWSELLEFIQSIASFVSEKMLFREEHLSKIFGRSLFLEDDMAQSMLTTTPSSNRSTISGCSRWGVGGVGGRHIDYSSSSSSSSGSSTYGQQYDDRSIMKVLIDLLGDECIPNTISSSILSKLHNIATFIQESTTTFENSLTECSLLPRIELDSNQHPQRQQQRGWSLSYSSKSFMKTFAEKQRTRILSQGRSILLDSDYHNTKKVGVNIRGKQKGKQPSYYEDMVDFNRENDDMSVFVLHECSISDVASNLLDLCVNTMEAAVNTDFSVDEDLERLLPFMLYRSARELFDLYRAIIPATYGQEVATIPRTAAVLHNDCVYFAHRMLRLGLEYKSRFPTLTDKNRNRDVSISGGDQGQRQGQVHESPMKCTFIDLVPIFRDLAERTMNDHIKYQMNQLSEVICPRITYLKDALRSNEGVMEWTDAETALTAGLYHLRHLSQSWWMILSYDVYSRTMGILVDTLFSFYLNEVMLAKDISEPACMFVSTLFRDATRGVAELFAVKEDLGESMKEAAKYCKMWNKFHAIGKFMNMSIADINMNLSEGTFRDVTGPELSRLVTAVYEDSDKRRTLLQLLANH